MSNNMGEQNSLEQPNYNNNEAGGGGAEQPLTTEARNMAMLCHLLGLVGFIGPLIVWLITREKHKFIDDHGKAAMNYQISLFIYYIVSWVLCFIIIGFFLIIALAITHLVLVIMASLKASNGESYRYPISIKFIN